MSSQKGSFLQALRLSPDLNDEECARSISDLLSSALSTDSTEQGGAITVQELGVAINKYQYAEYLDPLSILPLLLPCGDDAARSLIDTCGRHANAKEVMIVVQETIEDLQRSLRVADDCEQSQPLTSPVRRLINAIALFTTAMPHLKMGKKAPLELSSPVITNITSLVLSAAPDATVPEGRALLTAVARLCESLFRWVSQFASQDDQDETKNLLRKLLDTTVVAHAGSIQASLSARVFEDTFPRLIVKSAVQDGWNDGDCAMSEVQVALRILGGSLPTIALAPASMSDLVYLSHANPPVALSAFTLSRLHPLLIASLGNNVAVDESLSLILRFLTQTAPHADGLAIPSDIVSSLCTILPALASTHIDPFIRYLNLRLVSMLLSRAHPTLRFWLLLKLTAEKEFPQFRGPAIGLLKEAVLEALSSANCSAIPNPFVSPMLFRDFGPILFKPDPPDFFTTEHTQDELADSLELLRIMDFLSFYYVLLLRDWQNKTGIRDANTMGSVEGSLIQPLRKFLLRTGVQVPPLMTLQPLRVSLERIDEALSSVKGFPVSN